MGKLEKEKNSSLQVAHRVYNVSYLYDNSRTPTEEELGERQLEIEQCLQINLNNEHVANIHLLYFNPDAQTYLQVSIM